MIESSFRTFLLVQAAEESDRERRIVRSVERERASAEAAVAEGDDFLERRAEALLPAVEAALGRVVVRPPSWLLVAVVLVAFASGMVIDQIGGGRKIYLLSFPLLGLLAWNLLAAVASLAALVVPARFSSPGLLRLWARAQGAAFTRRAPGGVAAWRAETVGRFLSLWLRNAAGLEASRLRRALHLAAAAFAAGALSGLYGRGFVLEYRASWESTFLDAEGVTRILGILFGPAATLLGVALPEASAIEALRAPDSGSAAIWIHLWAATLTLWVILPRLLLAGAEALRLHRVRATLRPDRHDPYVLRLLAPSRGEGLSVTLLPYGYRPDPVTADALREIVLELFGNRTRPCVPRSASLRGRRALRRGGTNGHRRESGANARAGGPRRFPRAAP